MMMNKKDQDSNKSKPLEEEEVTEVGPKNGERPEAGASSEESLGTLRAERDEFKDKFLRTYAEFENFRKRTVRDKEELLKFSNEKLLREVLAIKDDLERASEHQESADLATLKEGLALIGRDLNKILTQFHVKEVEALGQPFDPTVHEAIGEREATGQEKGTVVEEYQKGYTYHGRLLRAAKVLVAK